MKKLKKSAYTVLLMATCFIASPFIVHRIWKTSSESKKDVNVSAPVVNTPDENSGSESQPVSDNVPPDGSKPSADNSLVGQDVLFQKSDLSYFDDALFIGDSRTVGIQEYGTMNKSDYFCSVGLSSEKINDEVINGITFDQAIDAKQYGKVYIMLGINEVGNDFEYTLTSYRAVVEKVKVHQPNALIYVQGNLHVSESAETNVINNEGINYLNGMIASLADNKRIFYIDINELYDDEYGCFNESYTSDGIHPLAMYYTKWCEWLCTKTVVLDNADKSAE